MEFGFSAGGEDFGFLHLLSRMVVVGCSRHPEKEAHAVPKNMKDHGFQVACVNPNADEIFGQKTFKSVEDVPKEMFEIVVVFRPPDEIPAIAKKLLESGRVPKIFWMQEGLRSAEARRIMESHGARVIEDRCISKVFSTLSASGKKYKQILEASKRYADAKNFILNPDPPRLGEVIAGLAANQEKYGYRFCPCRTDTGDLKKDKDKICPCKWHLDEIKRDGLCLCRLFFDPKRI